MIWNDSLLQIVKYVIQFFILAPISISQESIPAPGNCSNKPLDVPIDIRKLTGVWYELERWSTLEEWPFKCITIKVSHFYEMQSEVTYSRVDRFTGKREEKTFPLRAASDANDGKLVLGPSEFDPRPQNLSVQVLNTDYNNWGVVWSCNPYEGANVHSEMVWVFIRQKEPSDESLSKIEATLTSFHLENKRLYEVPQTNCDKLVRKQNEDTAEVQILLMD